jgi:hypothetical protein
MFALNQILLAEEPTILDSDGGKVAKEISDLFFPGNPITNSTSTSDSVPQALNSLWLIAMNGNMYKIVCSLGLLIAVIAVGFWCVKFYKTLEEGGLRPAINDLIFPILLVVLLSNSGDNMRKLTMGTREIMNGVNRSINTVIDSEVSFQSAISVIANTDIARDQINRLVNNCQAVADVTKFGECVQQHKAQANLVYRAATGGWPSGNGSKWQKYVDNWQTSLDSHKTNVFSLLTPSDSQKNSINISKIQSYDGTEEIRRVILSFRGAFLYIIEVMMLVTGLIGPIFLVLSLFPVGTKPLMAWGTSFLSLGFCKICFSLISGLSAVAMVYSGPDNVDMLVAAIILGLLAPVLAFSIASGSGLSALNTIAYSGQTFGLNTGVGFYNASTGQGNDNTGNSSSKTTTRPTAGN